jgi:signal-transduction protein with cAMP-binding, CBS, and nucleotidyltransferase domain
MDTATISYRVADFLKKHAPFQAMEDADLLTLAGQGRVRFHERHEHILSQGEAHKHFVFVIQQGVVSLWDEVSGAFELRATTRAPLTPVSLRSRPGRRRRGAR